MIGSIPGTEKTASDKHLFTVAFVTLGCAKNTVDTEKAMGALAAEGFQVTGSPSEADVVIVNTCGFIDPAKEESIDEILEMVELKRRGRPDTLVVGGCLAVRYREELEAELPEVDHFLGLVESEEVCRLCHRLAAGGDFAVGYTEPVDRVVKERPLRRVLTTPSHYAYLKIAEGCSNSCSFCAIPLIRGKTASVDPEELIREAHDLVEMGVVELILVAQDTTHYGSDLNHYPPGKRPDLADLIRRLDSEVTGLGWIRLMYTYPSRITDELLLAMVETQRVVPYVDIPVQSGSERVLKAMGRGMGRKELLRLLERIRENVPGVALRTSVIVGFPGETEKEFQETLDLVRRVRFERLGVFSFSPEEGTPAVGMKGRVPDEEMERRSLEVMELQRQIVSEQNMSLNGEIVEVMIDESLEGLPPFDYLGRTSWDAPEVDQGIYLELPEGWAGSPDAPFPENRRNLEPGDLVRAEVVGSTDYDLEGVLIVEPPG